MTAYSDEVYGQLRKLLDLPPEAVSCTIRFRVGEAVIVEIEQYVDVTGSDETITRKYELKEIDDAPTD
jgi:hypothetical protein